jgi:dipeptidase D
VEVLAGTTAPFIFVALLPALVAISSGCAGRRPTEVAPVREAERRVPCGDVAAYRELALRQVKTEEMRAAIRRWSPPNPVLLEDRDLIAAVARAYIAACGQDEVVALARALIAFPTVSAEAPAPDNPAFSAMASFLEGWAKENGLGFSVYGAHDVWEITLGEGQRSLGYVMHADVVPVREVNKASDTATVALTSASIHPPDWKHPPFIAEIEDGKLWGRGAEDDKGPIAAVLVAMKTLRAMGLVPRGQVLAILGTGEENDWDGMRRYVDARHPPDFVVSVDANFPVVIAESGFVVWKIGIKRTGAEGAAASSVGPKIVDANGGQFLTQVPGEASMTIVPDPKQSKAELLAKIEVVAMDVRQRLGPGFTVEAKVVPEGVVVTTKGEAVHSSVADEGKNALWPLALVAKSIGAAPTPIAKVLEMTAEYFVGDHHGQRLELSYEHPLMGRLLVAPTVLRVTDTQVSLSVNMRRPAGQTSEQFSAAIGRALDELKKIDPRFEELEERYVGEPAVADVSSPLVPTLLEIYERHTRKKGMPVSIRGGTYARLFRGAVSFGPSLPGEPYRGHAPDEHIELENLDLLARMILDATLRLASPFESGVGL